MLFNAAKLLIISLTTKHFSTFHDKKISRFSISIITVNPANIHPLAKR